MKTTLLGQPSSIQIGSQLLRSEVWCCEGAREVGMPKQDGELAWFLQEVFAYSALREVDE